MFTNTNSSSHIVPKVSLTCYQNTSTKALVGTRPTLSKKYAIQEMTGLISDFS